MKCNGFLALLMTSAATLTYASAHAEAAGSAGVVLAAAGSTTLEELVVTGEKREENLQRIPLAITAITSDRLQERNVNELNDLNGLVPGLTIAKSEGSARIVAVRGIGYETQANPNSQPGVAFHINGVYIAHVMATAQDLLDVDRVEVLRGPQGTVFGQTSTGGAINVITKQPMIGKFGGTAQVSYGNYNYVKASGAVNLPISDTMAARASVQYFRHDGYGYATAVRGVAKYPLDDADDFGARVSILWAPTDRFKAVLSGQTFDANHNGALQKNINDPNPDPRVVTQDFPSTFDLQTRMADLALSYDFDGFATLKSVTAYQFMDKHQTQDTDRLAGSFYVHTVRWRDRSSAWTQEVSLTSPTGQSVEWTAGAFYLRQLALKDYLSLGSNPALRYAGMPIVFATYSPYQHTSIAGYAQATWHVDDKLNLIAGGRYSWDKTTGQPINFFNQFGLANPRLSTSEAVTGKLAAEYRLTPANMVYAIGSRGYKPSGVNFNQGAVITPQTYKDETVWALEAGTKNEFFDQRLRLNASAYHYWYNNYQYTAEDPRPNAGGTANIPHAKIYGVEFEASLLPIDGLRFDATLSLSKGKFDGDYYTIDSQTALAVRQAASIALGLPQPYSSGYGYIPAVITAVQTHLQNTNGNSVPKLPGVQGNFTTTYTTTVGPGRLTASGEVVYRGSYNFRVFNVSALDRVPAYTLVNASVRYEPDNSPLTFTLSVQNLFDENGINSKFTDPYGALTTSVEYVNPRQVFGTIAYRF